MFKALLTTLSQSLWWIGDLFQASNFFKVIFSKFVLWASIMFYFQVYFNEGLCFGVLFFLFLFPFFSAFSIICVDLMIFPRSCQIIVCANMLRNYLPRILCCISFISLHSHNQFASMKFPQFYHSSFNFLTPCKLLPTTQSLS